jgi:ribonuclease BN (tRNA processing enzyme)
VSHPGDRIALNGIGVEVIPTANHAGGLGFSFDTSEGKVTYSGDTALDDATVGHYKGSHVLILNTLFPSGAKGETHLNTDDAIEIARIAKPKQLILTHFGVRMINVGPEKEASRVQEESGVHTIAAEDGMTILLSELGRLNSRK